jgi:hypothetical protein
MESMTADRRSRSRKVSGAFGARQPASLFGSGGGDGFDARDERADLGILYGAYQSGNWVTRQRLLEAPLMFLKSHKEAQAPAVVVEPSPGDNLLSDLEILSSAARRADRRLRQGGFVNLADEQRQELARCLDQSLHETQRLAVRAPRKGHALPRADLGALPTL